MEAGKYMHPHHPELGIEVRVYQPQNGKPPIESFTFFKVVRDKTYFSVNAFELGRLTEFLHFLRFYDRTGFEGGAPREQQTGFEVMTDTAAPRAAANSQRVESAVQSIVDTMGAASVSVKQVPYENDDIPF